MIIRPEVKNVLNSLGDIRKIELPRDATLDFIDVFIEAAVTGAGGGADIGAHNIVSQIELKGNGHPILEQTTGRAAYYLAAMLQGELQEQDAPDPSGGTVTLFTLLRIWLMNPRGLTPRKTRLNTRRLESLDLELTFAAATTAMYSGGTQAIAANAIRTRVYYGESLGRGGNLVVVHKAFNYVFDGSDQVVDWRENRALLRAMLIEEFDNSDVAQDGSLTTLGLKIDGKTDVLGKDTPSRYLRAKSTYASQLSAAEIPTGMSYHDVDPRSKGDARVSLSGSNVQLRFKGTNTHKLRVTRSQTVPLRSFGVTA